MHGHVSQEEFIAGISGFLGSYYITLATINGVAGYHLLRSGRARSFLRVPLLNFPLTLQAVMASSPSVVMAMRRFAFMF